MGGSRTAAPRHPHQHGPRAIDSHGPLNHNNRKLQALIAITAFGSLALGYPSCMHATRYAALTAIVEHPLEGACVMFRSIPAAVISLLAITWAMSSASAQNFSNAIFFGDSSSDSGRYLYLRPFPANPFSGAPPGAGAFTTNPGPEWSVALGQKFDITVTPSDAPGGGNNYAAGGAFVTMHTAGSNQWPVSDQISRQ